MKHEEEGAYLLQLLRERWGDEPNWTLRPNKEYGFYLLYRKKFVPYGDRQRLGGISRQRVDQLPAVPIGRPHTTS